MEDNFYEERFQQLKKDLFIGDKDHMLGKDGSYSLLYRLFEECYTFDEIFGILDNIHNNNIIAKKNPIIPFDQTSKMFLKKYRGYILVDEDNKLVVDYWDGEKFTHGTTPKAIMFHADADKYEEYIK